MKRSSLFYEFLTFPAEKMDKMKKNYESMNAVKTVHSLQTESGYANITLTNKVRNYAQTTIDYMRKAPKIHENISDSIAKVM